LDLASIMPAPEVVTELPAVVVVVAAQAQL
jgi:hypothetical protein